MELGNEWRRFASLSHGARKTCGFYGRPLIIDSLSCFMSEYHFLKNPLRLGMKIVRIVYLMEEVTPTFTVTGIGPNRKENGWLVDWMFIKSKGFLPLEWIEWDKRQSSLKINLYRNRTQWEPVRKTADVAPNETPKTKLNQGHMMSIGLTPPRRRVLKVCLKVCNIWRF